MIPLGRRVAATLFLLAALAACASATPRGEPVDDHWISAEALRVLQEDDRIDAESIRAETRDGVLILSGVVSSLDEVRRALSRVARIDGVTEVVNRLRVIPEAAQSNFSA